MLTMEKRMPINQLVTFASITSHISPWSSAAIFLEFVSLVYRPVHFKFVVIIYYRTNQCLFFQILETIRLATRTQTDADRHCGNSTHSTAFRWDIKCKTKPAKKRIWKWCAMANAYELWRRERGTRVVKMRSFWWITTLWAALFEIAM